MVAMVLRRDDVKEEREEDAAGVKPYAVEAEAMAKRAPVAVVNFMVAFVYSIMWKMVRRRRNEET